MGAIRAGAAQAARAVLGLGPGAERAPARTGRVGGRPVEIASFYDPALPAWFELSIDPRTGRLLALQMTAQAHFMRHRYSGFDAPLQIVPPAGSLNAGFSGATQP